MIDKHFLIPECYVMKVPKCDDCDNAILQHTGNIITPEVGEQLEYKCNKCNKVYLFKDDELRGEWKWRTI